jgi:hypothetical protein
MTSFPVPVSPRSSTVVSVGATCSTSCSTQRSGSLWPMMSSKSCSAIVERPLTLIKRHGVGPGQTPGTPV